MKNRDEVKNILRIMKYHPKFITPFLSINRNASQISIIKGDFPFAENATETSLAIPIYPDVSKEQIAFVVEKIKESVN